MSPENVYRFRTLIEFLWQLPAEKFNFRREVEKHDERNCGTVCCAIGWTPVVFPELVEWHMLNVSLYTRRKKESIDSPHGVANGLFGLNENEFDYLFQPTYGEAEPSECPLGPHITPQQLAAHLESFLSRKLACGEAEDCSPDQFKPRQAEPVTAQ